MNKSFTGNPRYRLVFQNQKGFNIGFNLIIIPASVSTLGTGGPEGLDQHVDTKSDASLFRRCVVNNAAYDFYSRCVDTDLDIPEPPSDFRIWIFPDLTCSSACMLHQGAFLSHPVLETYLAPYLFLIKLFVPDITIGTKEQGYAGIYSAVMHELSHASHYGQVGNSYWNKYIDYTIRSFILQGGKPYGSGGEGSQYCELGEMWAYFMQATLDKDRYGGNLASYNNLFWFKPDILSYLYQRGMSRGEIFRALGAKITDISAFKQELVTLYPEREKTILDTFKKYGK